MLTSPRLEQHPAEVVSLEGWDLDEEFPDGPQGAKPKRIFRCPNPPPHGFLIGGHRYIFKEPTGARAQQIWSEVIAYELSRDLGLPVPPAFLALGPGNGSPGVLVEFFYGYSQDPLVRFVHAIERMQGLNLPIDFNRGSLKDNITVCRLHRIQGWNKWWAKTLVFDAVIGNSDRHTENWGFLIDARSSASRYSLAPAFDNGTSLGHIIREEDLANYMEPARLRRLVEKGSHHFGWVGGDARGSQHARLCSIYRDRVSLIGNSMLDAINLRDHRIERIVEWCCRFSFPLPFSERRGEFVAAQLRARRNALAAALGV